MRKILPLIAIISTLGVVYAQTKDPLYQSKGDQKRTYTFPGTTEQIPYHLFVPSKWTPTTRLPLIVILHGNGVSADTPFERNEGIMGKLAEQRGYIVVAPTGYRTTSLYNNPYEMVAAVRPAGAGGGQGKGKGGGGGKNAPLTDEDRMRGEQDVMNVADMIAKEYNADPDRTYLVGNSVGGGATWYLGQKYLDRWAAIVPTVGPIKDDAFPYDRLKNMPILVIHGDADTTMSFDGTKAMVEHAKEHKLDVTFIPVKDGDHTGAWAQVAPQIFDFLDQHKRKK